MNETDILLLFSRCVVNETKDARHSNMIVFDFSINTSRKTWFLKLSSIKSSQSKSHSCHTYLRLVRFCEMTMWSLWLLWRNRELVYDDVVCDTSRQIWANTKTQLHTCIASWRVEYVHLIFDCYTHSREVSSISWRSNIARFSRKDDEEDLDWRLVRLRTLVHLEFIKDHQ